MSLSVKKESIWLKKSTTQSTEKGNAQQGTDTGAAYTELKVFRGGDKRYLQKNSEKAVAKVLKELGITDRRY